MANPAPDRDAEMLARLAEMDLTAAEHVHAQLVAATEADDVANLSRAYQRASRSLRQTLALKAKLARDAAQGVRGAQFNTAWPASPWAGAGAAHFDELAVAERVTEVQAAVDRVIHVETADDEPRREALFTRLDRELDDWQMEDEFLDESLDAQVLRACRLLNLPDDLAVRWRDLPDPHGLPGDDAPCDVEVVAVVPPAPRADTS